MKILNLFLDYAAEFELAYADDKWERLEKYFHPNATYTTDGIDHSKVEGRTEVLQTLKRNVTNFDRKCDSRLLTTKQKPKIENQTLSRIWVCEFSLQGAAGLTIEGRETAKFKDNLIFELDEVLTPSSVEQMTQWLKVNAHRL